MNTRLPVALIYSRLVLGFAILGLGIAEASFFKTLAVILITVGLVTNVFDGIIAQRLNVSNRRIKRLNSNVNQVFFLCVAGATFIQNPDFFLDRRPAALLTLIGCEALVYLICYLKFRREIATHSIAAKLWTLVVFVTLVEIILTGQSTWLFMICFILGLLSRIEIIAIILVLKRWASDVPSVFHAIKLRNDQEIKPHNLLNG